MQGTFIRQNQASNKDEHIKQEHGRSRKKNLSIKNLQQIITAFTARSYAANQMEEMETGRSNFAKLGKDICGFFARFCFRLRPKRVQNSYGGCMHMPPGRCFYADAAYRRLVNTKLFGLIFSFSKMTPNY